MGRKEAACVHPALLGHCVGECGIALDHTREAGTALLRNDRNGPTCQAESLTDHPRVSTTRASAHRREHADGSRSMALLHTSGSRLHDAHHDQRNAPSFQRAADVVNAVGRCGIAGDHDGFDWRFIEAEAFLPGIEPALSHQKNGVLHDELAQGTGAPRAGVVAVGHVCLIAKVLETLIREVGLAISSGLKRFVVKGIHGQQGLQYRESADSGVKNTDGQVIQLSFE